MLQNYILLLLLGISLVSAHGKVTLARGDGGGNGTALGIHGGVVPGTGPNNVTEVDTTVFNGASGKKCGYTKGFGVNVVETGTQAVMLLSGKTLPQVTPGGYLYGILHVVVSDGWGPYSAFLDVTGAGDFTNAINMTVVTQVPGINGLYPRTGRRKVTRMLESIGLMKRTDNVNQDWPFKVSMPTGMTCTGKVAGLRNVCIVKFVNPSGAGPFGGCIPIQLAAASATQASTNTDPLATSTRSTTRASSISTNTMTSTGSNNPSASKTTGNTASITSTASPSATANSSTPGTFANKGLIGGIFLLLVTIFIVAL